MKILVAIDFSDVTVKIIDYIKTHYRGSDHEVLLIHVADPEPDFIGFEAGPKEEREFMAKHYHEEHHRIQSEAESLRSTNSKVSSLLLQGSVAEKILSMSLKNASDLIILGSHGHGAMFKFLVGSVTEAVLKDSSCPVLVIPYRGAYENT